MPVTNVARLLAASIIVFGVFHAAESLAQELTHAKGILAADVRQCHASCIDACGIKCQPVRAANCRRKP